MRPQPSSLIEPSPSDPRHVIARVESAARGERRAAGMQARLEQTLRPLDAEADPTRTLLSERQFDAFLRRERDLADRGTRCFCLLSLAVRAGDPGSRAGSSALGELARAVLRRVRSTDLVGRLSGGRLGILLTDTEPAGAQAVEQWLRRVATQFGLVLESRIGVYPFPQESAEEHAADPDPDLAAPLVDLGPSCDIPTPAGKRALDILVAAPALLLLLPLFALIAIAIRLDSPGPVIFRQPRAGRGGRPFAFYKFRSMLADAEARRAALASRNEQEGPVFKIQADPRVTRVGRLLRRWSLDELPQLWNVLRGDISLVGPRSPTLDEVAQYERWQRRRLSVTGGITCTWQVSGRNQIPFREWMRLDLRYVACRSLWLDLRLLARTLPAVISGRGAY